MRVLHSARTVAARVVDRKGEPVATDALNATSAPLLGHERLLRGDLYHGQPCPTDPPGGPPGASTSPPRYEWSWLFPRFGWDYYICHNFDSP